MSVLDENSPSVTDGLFSFKKGIRIELPDAPAPDSDVYKKYRRRGTAIIFNHKYFINDCTTREGTEKDRDALENVLKELMFDVTVYEDLTCEEVSEVLHVVSKMDHSESSCLVISVMSHGDNGILYAKDTYYETEKLWKYFSPLYCPSLAAKPKLFFIQACRGNKTDPGFEVTYVHADSDKKSTDLYTIPVMADILVMYATVEGYYAWRDPSKGSYFVQSLVNEIRKGYKNNKDLLTILTGVNREVAIGFTSVEPNWEVFNRKKEMCCIVSMLTRLFYFN
ncbi:caspase-1-like [Diorhabda carinulata]|uniref:caspase-1-like n=1 Tax=Diorhabda carinulata TaxID=1163345 RepID=UPI0025A0F709|nr:caspase-1-like [Diorhabda carinulata]